MNGNAKQGLGSGPGSGATAPRPSRPSCLRPLRTLLSHSSDRRREPLGGLGWWRCASHKLNRTQQTGFPAKNSWQPAVGTPLVPGPVRGRGTDSSPAAASPPAPRGGRGRACSRGSSSGTCRESTRPGPRGWHVTMPAPRPGRPGSASRFPSRLEPGRADLCCEQPRPPQPPLTDRTFLTDSICLLLEARTCVRSPRYLTPGTSVWQEEGGQLQIHGINECIAYEVNISDGVRGALAVPPVFMATPSDGRVLNTGQVCLSPGGQWASRTRRSSTGRRPSHEDRPSVAENQASISLLIKPGSSQLSWLPHPASDP